MGITSLQSKGSGLGLGVHHIGVATPDIGQLIGFYTDGLGLRLLGRELIGDQAVEVAFLDGAGARVELLRPVSDGSALARFLEKRGPGLHHVCFEVDCLAAAIERLKQLGFRLVDETPRVGAEDSLIAFVDPKSAGGVLVELLERSDQTGGLKLKADR